MSYMVLVRGSARVLWWNSQENAREGGSWIGIENMSGKQHHQAITLLSLGMTGDTSAYGFLPHPYRELAVDVTRYVPTEQNAE